MVISEDTINKLLKAGAVSGLLIMLAALSRIFIIGGVHNQRQLDSTGVRPDPESGVYFISEDKLVFPLSFDVAPGIVLAILFAAGGALLLVHSLNKQGKKTEDKDDTARYLFTALFFLTGSLVMFATPEMDAGKATVGTLSAIMTAYTGFMGYLSYPKQSVPQVKEPAPSSSL